MLCKSWAFWRFLPQLQGAEFFSLDWFWLLVLLNHCQCSHLSDSRGFVEYSRIFWQPESIHSQGATCQEVGAAEWLKFWVTRPVLSLFFSALLEFNISSPQRERTQLWFQPGRRNPKQNWDFHPAAWKIHLRKIKLPNSTASSKWHFLLKALP